MCSLGATMSPPRLAAEFRAVLSLVGGFFLHLTLGTIFCFGNMSTYMTSYLRKFVQPDIVYSDMIWVVALTVFTQGSCMILGGLLEERLGLHCTLFLGSGIMSLGVLLTYVSIQTSASLTLLTYGAMYGLGIAIAYSLPLRAAMKWFPRHQGMASGIVLSGFGLGAFVFNQVQTLFLNPENEMPEEDGYFANEDVLERVPSVFVLLAAAYSTLQALSILLISEPGAEDSLLTPLLKLPEDIMMELSPSEVVRTRRFWLLWATFFLNAPAIVYLNSMYKAYGQTFVRDDHFLAVVGAVAAVFNAGGRIFWGILHDSVGFRCCMAIATGLIGLLYATLRLAYSKVAFAPYVWGIFFCFSASYVLMPTATAQCFGTGNSSKNYGLVTTAYAVSSLLTAAMTQFLSPHISWTGMFLIIAAFSLTSTALNCWVK